MIHHLKRPTLTWPQWSKKPENQKLIAENVYKAKLKYKHDLMLAEDYNRYMMMMMGLKR